MSDETTGPARMLGILALLALMAGCLLVLRPFLSALVWAAILAFATWPAYRALTARLRMGPNWAAALMVLAMFLLIGLPLLFAAPTNREDADRLREAVESLLSQGVPGLTNVLERIPLLGPFLLERWTALGLDFSGLFSMVQPYVGNVAQLLLAGVLAVLSGLAELVLAIFLAFFFYRDGARIAAGLEQIASRVAGGRGRHLVVLAGSVTQGVVYGLLGTAVVQGLMTGFGLWLASVPQPVLLGVVAGVISILPIGAPVVWIPAAIYLFSRGSTGWGIFMLVYGAFGISSVDNFIRPWLIARGADLPLLLTILGALGGALAFGFLGLFLGPVLLAVGYTLLKDWADDGRSRRQRVM